ncbi:uncharacterized protein [Chironomus tepperi]|uniref:uncharacterized protein n=1 Tax=Chironomus tepperi TaxID=113505 RepID=UPI00391F2F13
MSTKMSRFQRLWRYEKLANENVKDETVIDDGDYNSCFQLRKNLKNTCKKLIIMKSQQQHYEESKVKEVTVEDAASVATEKKIIKKLREQQNNKQNKNQKSLYKCLNKFLSKVSTQHERLHDLNEGEEKSGDHDEYVASGIYEIFGKSCSESVKTAIKPIEIEAEDLTSNSWYQSGLLGKFSLEMLKHQSPGSFIIHKSSQKSSNFILSLRVPSKSSSKVNHYLILQSKKGYRIKGESKFFPTVASLVTHHSVMSEQLPVTLMVHRETSNLVHKHNDDFSSLDDLNIIFTDLE